MNDFKNHPVSITELRAARSDAASEWTPRDALIDTLRRIDSGELDIDAVLIVYREQGPDNTSAVAVTNAAPDRHSALGILLEGLTAIEDAP